MDEVETYEPEVPREEFVPKELGWLKTIFLCIAMTFVGGGLAFVVVVTGMTPQFLTDQDCYALQNESFINGTKLGYNQGVYDTSQGVIENDIMVVFLNNGTHIILQEWNMSVYYSDKLNLSKDNNGI